jgi:CheY-like chemotaxis protein
MDEARRRILVAEDDPLIREIIVDMLVMLDFDLIVAASGHEALRLIDMSDGADLLITDLNMPGMDGIELAHHVRGFYPEIPILFVSGRLYLLETGSPPEPYRCLRKPFRMRELTKTVSDMLVVH